MKSYVPISRQKLTPQDLSFDFSQGDDALTLPLPPQPLHEVPLNENLDLLENLAAQLAEDIRQKSFETPFKQSR